MIFANLTAFWALLLAIPIVAVYLIRNRPSTRSVSTLLFWEQVIDEPGATAFLRRLRHPGSLLIQLALLLLFTLALSDPSYHATQMEANHRVLVIDNSASMQAVDSNSESRLELAIAEAAAAIDGMSPTNEIAIVISSPCPQVICPPTTSRALAKSRLNTVQQTDCVGRIHEAINFAGSIANNAITKSIVVITDGNDSPPSQANDAAASIIPGSITDSVSPDVSTIKVGQSVTNAGLTLFRVRRSATDPMLWHLLYEVSNFSDSSINLNLEVRRDNILIDVLPLNLKPAESRRDVLTKTSTEGGLITGTLRASGQDEKWTDALAIDNQATSLLANRPIIDVTLATNGNWFLQQALRANPLVRLTVVKNDSLLQTAKSTTSIVVFDSIAPQSWPPEDSEIPIRALVIAPKKSNRLWTVNGDIDTTFVGDYQETHPLVEYVQLEDIAINSASDVTLVDEAKIIVTALEGQPLLASYEIGNTRILMLAVNLGRSDLPLRSSFPILLTNALEWLNQSSPEMLPQADTDLPTAIATGLPAIGDASDAAATWTLTHEGGQSQSVAVADNVANLGQLTKVGLYTLQVARGDRVALDGSSNANSMRLPCNLVSRQESRLNQPINATSINATTTVTTAGGHWNIQTALLALVMLAVIAECWLWHRRKVE